MGLCSKMYCDAVPTELTYLHKSLVVVGEGSRELKLKTSVCCFFGKRQQQLQNAVGHLAYDSTKTRALSREQVNVAQGKKAA